MTVLQRAWGHPLVASHVPFCVLGFLFLLTGQLDLMLWTAVGTYFSVQYHREGEQETSLHAQFDTLVVRSGAAYIFYIYVLTSGALWWPVAGATLGVYVWLHSKAGGTRSPTYKRYHTWSHYAAAGLLWLLLQLPWISPFQLLFWASVWWSGPLCAAHA